jgi:hypothetical protein
MRFLFDTGSSWLWTPSSDCPDTECTKGHYKYHESSTFQSLRSNKKVTYGIGGVEGIVSNDYISLEKSTGGKTKLNFLLVNSANDLD